MVDKERIVEALVATLEKERETLAAAQRLTAEGVTHEDARSDGSKDMRATEASYIARGQAQRAEALATDLARVRAMKLRDFGQADAVAVSAAVTVEGPKGEQHLFVAPAGGGMRIDSDGVWWQVVTPASPMGRALLGARRGDVVELRRGEQTIELELLALA